MRVGFRWRGLRSEFGSNHSQQFVILRRVLCVEGSVQLDVRDPALDGFSKLHRSLRLRQRAGSSARKGREPQDDSGLDFFRPVRGFSCFPWASHSLRCGLHSSAASRLLFLPARLRPCSGLTFARSGEFCARSVRDAAEGKSFANQYGCFQGCMNAVRRAA